MKWGKQKKIWQISQLAGYLASQPDRQTTAPMVEKKREKNLLAKTDTVENNNMLLLHKRNRGKKGSLPCRRQTLIGQRNSRQSRDKLKISSSKNNDDCLWANFLVQKLYFCRPTDRPTVLLLLLSAVRAKSVPKTNEPQE
ncbi:hypothetical protein T08_15358 [Trichinella sp. T8]|nr:hypothetical protein T08_15358 [Trichinella sp. T8]